MFNLFQVKQRDADKVDLWLTNSHLLPFAVMNATLSQKLQGVMKVHITTDLNTENVSQFKPIEVPSVILKTSSGQDLTRMPLLPPVCQVMNFSGPVTVRQGCWRVLSLQLLSRALPVNQLSTLTLDTSLGTALHIPLYFHSTPFKVNHQLLWLVGNVLSWGSAQDQRW